MRDGEIELKSGQEFESEWFTFEETIPNKFVFVLHPCQVEDRYPFNETFRRMVEIGEAIVSPQIPESWL